MSFNSVAQKGLIKKTIFSQTSGCIVSDPDACAYLSATGITDVTQSNAINQLVIDLKADNLWTLMDAIYPIIGGTSFTHKFNLKNPLDTDSAFRLSFNGAWTHSSTGATATATALTYANSHLSMLNNTTIDDFHVSMYSRTDLNGAFYDWGTPTTNIQFFSRLSNLIISDSYDTAGGAGRITSASATSIGFFIASRTTPIKHAVYFNGVSQAFNNTTVGSLVDTPIYFGSSGGTGSGREYAFFTIGVGLDDTQSLNLYNAIQIFQTTLGRNI